MRLRNTMLAAVVLGLVLGGWRIGTPGHEPQEQPQTAKKGATVEQLLSADTVAFLRWDGSRPHRPAWEQTTAYAALSETTLGEFLTKSVEQIVISIQGEDAQREDIARQTQEFLSHVGQEGLVVAIAVGDVPPRQFSITLFVPKAGTEQRRELFVEFFDRAVFSTPQWKQHERSIADRAIVEWSRPDGITAAAWAEGEHFVLTYGPEGAEAILNVAESQKPNIAQNRLYRSYSTADEPDFEQAATAWVDTARLRELFGDIPLQPGVTAGHILESLGLDRLDAVAFQWGFSGRRLQMVVTVEAPAPRRGLLELLDQKAFTLDQLPPLPADGNFYAFSLNTGELYDESLETLRRVLDATSPEMAPVVEATVVQLDLTLGVNLREDVLAHLGHVAAFTSEGGGGLTGMLLPAMAMAGAGFGGGLNAAPGMAELGVMMSVMMAMGGLGGLNFALVFEVEDAAALEQSLHRLNENLLQLAEGRLTISRRDVAGTVMKSYRLDQEGMLFTPTVALTDRWLVIGTYPQPVQATLLRQAGKLPAWEPPAEVIEALAGLPGEVTSFSTTDPRLAVSNLWGLLPLGVSLADSSASGVDLDVSLLPPAELVNRYLFPNVTVSVVDEESIRWIQRSSISVPNMSMGNTATTGVLVALLLPAVQQAREAARRAQSASNVRQAMLSLLNYDERYRRLPSGTHPNRDLPPTKRFSWLADLLPFIEQAPLYDALDFAKSWDDPTHREAASTQIDIWLNPGQPGPEEVNGYGATHYVGIAGLGEDAAELPARHERAGVFGYDRQLRLADVPDGTANTIAVMEVSQEIGPWAAGGHGSVRAFTQPPYINGPDGFGGVFSGGANTVFLDGSTRFISESVDSEVFEALVTTHGGEKVTPDF